ncbi:hypothetical protein MMC25_001374 [Agyrium rufum]|nr:hypothetical protein [Agyrium rufum]
MDDLSRKRSRTASHFTAKMAAAPPTSAATRGSQTFTPSSSTTTIHQPPHSKFHRPPTQLHRHKSNYPLPTNKLAGGREHHAKICTGDRAAFPWVLEHILAYPGHYEIPLRTIYTSNVMAQTTSTFDSSPPSLSNGSSPDNSPLSPSSPALGLAQTLRMASPLDTTSEHFKLCLMEQISENPYQPFSLPPSFITSFVRRCFTEDLCLVDFTQALTALDYLKDLDNRRKRDLSGAVVRLGAVKAQSEDRSDAEANADVDRWITSMEEKERKVEALYTQVYIGLRRWTLINEMRLEPFSRPNCIAMLNTLYPENVQTLPTQQLTQAILNSQRHAFYRYVKAVENSGKGVLMNLENQSRRPQDDNGWPVVREIVDKYLRAANSIIEECYTVTMEAFKVNDQTADATLATLGGKRGSSEERSSIEKRGSSDKRENGEKKQDSSDRRKSSEKRSSNGRKTDSGISFGAVTQAGLSIPGTPFQPSNLTLDETNLAPSSEPTSINHTAPLAPILDKPLPLPPSQPEESRRSGASLKRIALEIKRMRTRNAESAPASPTVSQFSRDPSYGKLEEAAAAFAANSSSFNAKFNNINSNDNNDFDVASNPTSAPNSAAGNDIKNTYATPTNSISSTPLLNDSAFSATPAASSSRPTTSHRPSLSFAASLKKQQSTSALKRGGSKASLSSTIGSVSGGAGYSRHSRSQSNDTTSSWKGADIDDLRREKAILEARAARERERAQPKSRDISLRRPIGPGGIALEGYTSQVPTPGPGGVSAEDTADVFGF